VLRASGRKHAGAPTRLETRENASKTVAFGNEHAADALDAYSRFGKGRHPAVLNFGACSAYAIASLAGEPLRLSRLGQVPGGNAAGW